MNREILRREVHFEAVLSRGPGGQNVNRTASAAQLNWWFMHSALLSAQEKQRLQEKLKGRINQDGAIYLRCDEFRDLDRNKERCLDKLMELVAKALYVPKQRRPTKPTRSSQIKRLESKSRRSETKKLRRKDVS